MRLSSALLLCLALRLPAADLVRLRAAYLGIRDNGELFVGEAVLWVKDEGGDLEQAKAVGIARARGSLAQAIEVRVQSRTELEAVASSKGSTETARQQDISSTDLKLAGVKTQAFEDFPKPGQLTVLAWISKEEWRRQAKGKGPIVYRPQNGLRLLYGAWYPDELGRFPVSHPNEQKAFGAGLVWRGWSLEGMTCANSILFEGSTHEADMHSEIIQFGYNWAPFAWRLQPFAPIGLAWCHQQFEVEGSTAHGSTFAGHAGLGLRYWASDSLALEFLARRYLGLSKSTGGKLSYQVLGPGPAVAWKSFSPEMEFSGGAFSLQLLWSAF